MSTVLTPTLLEYKTKNKTKSAGQVWEGRNQVKWKSSAGGKQCSGWFLKQHPHAAGAGDAGWTHRGQEPVMGPDHLGGCLRPCWCVLIGMGHRWAVPSVAGTEVGAG